MLKRLVSGLVTMLVVGTGWGMQSVAAQQACQFVIVTDQAPLYNAPLPHISQQTGVLARNAVYPVLQTTPVYLDSLVLLSGTERGDAWALRRHGELKGDCARVPIDETPVAAYPAVCTFTIAASANDVSRTLPVIGFENGAYLLWLDHARSEWADSDTGKLGGACLADEPTATARANARLWSSPDVGTGSRLATLPLNTPMTVLAGPVRGAIRTDIVANGDWYRVVDAAGRIGWVWSERLTLN
jgi:hypothetical protein